MPGHGSQSWKQPRTVQCCDCPAVFETHGLNTIRCPACQKAHKRLIWRNYNNAKRDRAKGIDKDKNVCMSCPHLARCRALVNTQAPVMCQRGDRELLKASEIIVLERQPAYLRERLSDFLFETLQESQRKITSGL